MTKQFTIAVMPDKFNPSATGELPAAEVPETKIVRPGDRIIFTTTHDQAIDVFIEEHAGNDLFEVRQITVPPNQHVTLHVKAKVDSGKSRAYKLLLEIKTLDEQASRIQGKPIWIKQLTEKGTIVVVGGSGPSPGPKGDKKDKDPGGTK
jgi:hypothetical protein